MKKEYIELIQKGLIINIILFVFGCSGLKNKKIEIREKNITTITVSENSLGKSIEFKELFDSVSFLKLETTENNILGLVQKFKISKKNYYLLTGFLSNKIVVFNKRNGKCNLVIDKNGRGPGEYILPTDLCVDSLDRSFYIYSRGLNKIIQYNLEGDFIQEINLNAYINSFQILNSNLLAYSSALGYTVYLLDINGKILKKFLPNKYPEYVSFGDMNNFELINDSIVHFTRSIDNNIFEYNVEDKILYPVYSINFENHNIPDNFFSKQFYDVKDFEKNLNSNKYAYKVYSYFENKDFLIIRFVQNKKIHLLLYSKKTSHLYVIRNFIFNMYEYGFLVKIKNTLDPLGLDNNELIFALEPMVIKKWSELILNNSDSTEWKNNTHYFINLARSLNKDDNYVIMKCHLKEI